MLKNISQTRKILMFQSFNTLISKEERYIYIYKQKRHKVIY